MDVGITFRKPFIDVQADWYYNRVEDRIVCLPLKGSYQWTMLNYGYTRCMGVDSAEAGYLLGDWLLGKKKKKAKEMDGELEMKNGVNDNLSLSVAPTGIEFAIKL